MVSVTSKCHNGSSRKRVRLRLKVGSHAEIFHCSILHCRRNEGSAEGQGDRAQGCRLTGPGKHGGQAGSDVLRAGDYDVVVIADLPNRVSVAGFALVVAASGLVDTKTTALF